jgi:hypothetical protein
MTNGILVCIARRYCRVAVLGHENIKKQRLMRSTSLRDNLNAFSNPETLSVMGNTNKVSLKFLYRLE